MEEVMIKVLEDAKMKNVILIEGLPGVGNVGKVAMDYMIEKLELRPFARIFSKNLPPQVLLDEKGILRLVSQDIYHYKKGRKDFVFLAGEYQGADSRGQYELAYRLLEFLNERYGIKRIYTLGGYGLGKMLDSPRVLGAATSEEVAELFRKKGVVFSSGEPSNGIVGASGILLGLGKEFFGIEGGCLMGETSGYIVDARSARNVLEILLGITGIDIDLEDLNIKSEEAEELINNLREAAEKDLNKERGEDLRYIG